MKKLFNTGAAYGPVSKFLHWVIAFFVVLMLAATYFIGDVTSDKMVKGMLFNIHKLIGLWILLLMILRTLWALMNPKPHALPGSKKWERTAEHCVHYLFYIALLAMPILGWVATSASQHAPRVGSMVLMLPIAPSEALADLCFGLHNKLAIFLIGLVSLHAVAALYHQYVKRDGVMRRMWAGPAA